MHNLGTCIREFALKYKSTMQDIINMQQEVHSNDPETAINAVLVAAGIIDRANARLHAGVVVLGDDNNKITCGLNNWSPKSPHLVPTTNIGTNSSAITNIVSPLKQSTKVTTESLQRLQDAINALKEVNFMHGAGGGLVLTQRWLKRPVDSASDEDAAANEGNNLAVLLPDTERNLLLLRLQLFTEDMNKVVEELLSHLPDDDGDGSDGNVDDLDEYFSICDGEDETTAVLRRKRRKEETRATRMRTLREKATLPSDIAQLQNLCEDLHERYFMANQKLITSEKQKEELLYRLNARDEIIRSLRAHFSKQIIATVGNINEGGSSALVAEVSRFAGIPIDFIKEQDIEFARRVANNQLAIDDLRGRFEREIGSLRVAAKKQINAKEKEIIQLQIMFRNALRTLQGNHAITVSKMIDENINLRQTGSEVEQLAMQRAEDLFEHKMSEKIVEITQQYEGKIISLEEQLKAANETLKITLEELKNSRKLNNKLQKNVDWLQATLNHAMLIEFPHEINRISQAAAAQHALLRDNMDELRSHSERVGTFARTSTAKLSKQLEDLTEERDKLCTVTGELDEKLRKVNIENKTLLLNQTKFQSNFVEKEQGMKVLQIENEKLRKSIREGDAKSEEWNKKVNNLQQLIDEKDEIAASERIHSLNTINKLQEQLQTFKLSLNDSDNTLLGIRTELVSAKAEHHNELADMQSKYISASEIVKQYGDTIADLRQKLPNTGNGVADAEAKVTIKCHEPSYTQQVQEEPSYTQQEQEKPASQSSHTEKPPKHRSNDEMLELSTRPSCQLVYIAPEVKSPLTQSMFLEEGVQCTILSSPPLLVDIDTSQARESHVDIISTFRSKPQVVVVHPSAAAADIVADGGESKLCDADYADERLVNAHLRAQLSDLHTRIRYANNELHATAECVVEEYLNDYSEESDGLSRSATPKSNTFITGTSFTRNASKRSSSIYSRMTLELSPIPLSRIDDITIQNRDFRNEVIRRLELLKDTAQRLRRCKIEQEQIHRVEPEKVVEHIVPTPPMSYPSLFVRPPTCSSVRSGVQQPRTRPQSAIIVRYHMSAMPPARRAMEGTDRPNGSTLGAGFRIQSRPSSGFTLSSDTGDYYEDTDEFAAENEFDAAAAATEGTASSSHPPWSSDTVRRPNDNVCVPSIATTVYDDDLPKYVWAIDKNAVKMKPASSRTAGGPFNGRLTPRGPMRDFTSPNIPITKYCNINDRIAVVEKERYSDGASSKIARMYATKGLFRGSPSSFYLHNFPNGDTVSLRSNSPINQFPRPTTAAACRISRDEYTQHAYKPVVSTQHAKICLTPQCEYNFT